jgi:putative spermidine/putrescine transport system permease protein
MKSRAALYAYATLVAAWLIAPTLIVVPLSFTDKASLRFPPTGWSTRWYVNFFEDPNWTAAMTASLKVASLVALVTTVIATMAAVALTRSAFRGRSLVYGSLLAPMIVPAVIIGIGTYAIFLKFNLMGTLPGFVAAHTVLALPFALIPINASLTGFDVRLEDAAMICGANRLTAFRLITLPLVAPGVASGALFAFVTSFDEVVVSLFIQSPYLQTLPVQMYASVTRDTDPTIAAAATLILLLTTALVLAASLFAARRAHVR